MTSESDVNDVTANVTPDFNQSLARSETDDCLSQKSMSEKSFDKSLFENGYCNASTGNTPPKDVGQKQTQSNAHRNSQSVNNRGNSETKSHHILTWQ